MTEEPLGLQWATQSYEEALADADNHVTLGDRQSASRFLRDAFRICVETLGREWLAREGSAALDEGFLGLDAATSVEDPGSTEPIMRLFDLAVELHEARNVRGFEHLAVDLRSRSLYAALAELRAVNHMVRAGEDAWFVNPNESKGRSYDAVVVLQGIEVAVEVKVKLPKPVGVYRPVLIANPLNHARKQLPSGGPSLIYLQLASPWTDDPAIMSSIDETIKAWLAHTTRVNGVRVMAERHFVRPGAPGSRMRGSYYISNPRARTAIEDL